MLHRPRLLGILNVTPDSFSDGGAFLDPSRAAEHALRLFDESADMVDLGAESTRPGSAGVADAEQLSRLIPVLKKIRAQTSRPLSIDTQSAAVARACLDEGAVMINDISALRADPHMLPLLAGSQCEIILMHMQGTPQTMQQRPVYTDVVAEIGAFLSERCAVCAAAGIGRERLWLDPGFGFGKTFEHNLEIARRFESFTALGRCVGALSRKSFIGRLSGETAAEHRDAASVIAGLELVRCGALMLRVHDVAAHARALRILDAI